MNAIAARHPARSLHPLHAMLLGFPVALFAGALLADWAYSASHQVQWLNFAAWFLLGGVVSLSLVLLWALIDLFRWRRSGRGAGAPMLYALLLFLAWAVAVIDNFVHAKDAWATMPDGLWLTILLFLLTLAAALIGALGIRSRETA